MDAELPVLAGYLNVPTQSGFSLNRISKKKSCLRYCLLFKSSRHGIERLEICESKEDKNPKIITLENCVKITQEAPPSNQIQIVKKTGTLSLNTLNDEDLKDWVNALQTVAFRDKTGGTGAQLVIEEDNDLYCSSFGDGLFIVTLIPSDASIRCNIEPKVYMLNLTSTELQLKSVDDLTIVIATWPYRFIRKYGYRDGKFTFEAGRKCSTGEGVFTLDNKNPQEVFRCMSAKMKSMKKLITGDTLNSNDCGENQLSIAASMEAGSRSPLPPSPNQHGSEFEINTTPSCTSLRQLISSSDSLNNLSVNSNTNNYLINTTLPVKQVPNKPPRKFPQFLEKPISTQTSLQTSATNSVLPLLEQKSINQVNCDKLKKFQNYEPVTITTESLRKTNALLVLPIRKDKCQLTLERDYECIETITDAWKTLGVTDIKHTECNSSVNNEDEFIDFVRQRSLSQREKPALKESITQSAKTPKIINIDIGEGSTLVSSSNSDAAYDRLDFLCPNNKTSSGYKTIVTLASPANRICCSPPLNDYELIASPDTQSYRKADDSYLGYGVLRKTTTGVMKASPNVSHANAPTGLVKAALNIFDENSPNQTVTPSSKSTTNILNATANNDNFRAKPTSLDLSTATTSRAISNNVESNLDHAAYNGLNYSIVIKPKSVITTKLNDVS